MCSLCAELERLSYETWDRIMFARARRGLRIYETTLTQNILFSLRLFQERCTDYSLSLFEAIDETTNGNDIELIVQTSRGYLKLPTQAKLLYGNLKYSAINHPGRGGYQVDDLINYALGMGGIPMYLLYNHVPHHHTAFRDHGCTMLTADYIKNNFSPARATAVTRWRIPSFDDLHRPALPWHDVLCGLLVQEDVSIFLNEINQNIDTNQIRFYTSEELGDERWQEFQATPSIESTILIEDDGNEVFREEPIDEFNPRFRVIISNEEQ